ncbi:MAG: CDP-archaeol synthase [Arenicellales bacterium]|jgi:CDP-2,3-bis-(O-geranylgeranyl)-sn-glycerol synthase
MMFEALILLLVANGTPVLAGKFLDDYAAWPLDANYMMADGKPLLGKSKTLRGILLAVCATAITSEIFGLGWQLGASFGALSMLGDLFSSFSKRRLGMPSGSQAPGLDQVPEALLPLAVCASPLGLQWFQVLITAGLFWLLEVMLSRVLYSLNIRKHPW